MQPQQMQASSISFEMSDEKYNPENARDYLLVSSFGTNAVNTSKKRPSRSFVDLIT
jgi:hypothetical protein